MHQDLKINLEAHFTNREYLVSVTMFKHFHAETVWHGGYFVSDTITGHK